MIYKQYLIKVLNIFITDKSYIIIISCEYNTIDEIFPYVEFDSSFHIIIESIHCCRIFSKKCHKFYTN